jgi:mono/diheme cytochrome c family protein
MRTASIALALAVTGAVLTVSGADPVSFSKDVQPILHENCWGCHGPTQQLSKLSLYTRDAAMKGGEHGAVIIPGKAEKSRLYRLVAGLDMPQMPFGGGTLTDKQIATLKAWINQGAPWDAEPPPAVTSAAAPDGGPETHQLPPGARNYWAFKLPVQATVPYFGEDLTNPVDRFLEKGRREKGLKAAPRADRQTLVRRAYLDLLGLPPTPAEVSEFVNDTAPDAWSRLIDKLLDSPRYGERWGRHWLDVARYADSSGFEYDYDRPEAWRYRDYVVRSYNQDKPYNVFIKEQIAGDELDWKTEDSMIATGFLRAGARVAFREKDNPERRYDYLDDLIATVGRGVLGLTVQCARCHDHKFDPILQRDYYAMEASLFGYVETTYPLVPRPEAEAYQKKMAEIDAAEKSMKAEIKTIEAPIFQRLMAEAVKTKFPSNVREAFEKPEKDRTEGERLLVAQIPDAFFFDPLPVDKNMTPEEAARKKVLREQIAALEKQRPKPIAMAEIATDGDYRSTPDGRGDETIGCPQCRVPDPSAGPYVTKGDAQYHMPPSYLLLRGDPDTKGVLMKPGFVTVATYGNPPTEIPPSDGHTSGRRRALAEWLVSPQNPLTARVEVNRIWANHFGRGIVGSVDNFGKMGDAPSHPELLDWLAVEFMNRGWSTKEMHRLIMSSQAYQMASSYDNQENISKDPEDYDLWRYRMKRLDSDAVRDSIMAVSGALNLAMGGPPVFPPMPKELLDATIHNVWVTQPDGPQTWRRSVYVYRKRNLNVPMLEVFDMPDPNITAGPRAISTVPTQSLTLLNDDFVRHQAKLFAGRVEEGAPNDVAKQIDLAYRIALSRPPDDQELEIGMDLVKKQGLEDFVQVVLNLNEFLYLR